MDRLKETLGKALLPILDTFGKILLKLMPFINLVAGLFDKAVPCPEYALARAAETDSRSLPVPAETYQLSS